ncbi:uncharacterized protein LOC104419297 [Eucalyptus grandis]|uniref:uncharacterized protein LOC104419297 n=1 Tax=Eucalyptus grandis TaxID=71139 RepID=UPI00192E8D48|nr:uncharacterized protein LOC104419297 [Eucalyptus grandis]
MVFPFCGVTAFCYLFYLIPWRSQIPAFVCLACWFLSGFTLMPADIPDNNPLVISSGVMITVIGVAARWLDKHAEGSKYWSSICSRDMKKSKFSVLFLLQVLLVGLSSMMVSLSTSHRMQNQELHILHRFLSWLIAATAYQERCPGASSLQLSERPSKIKKHQRDWRQRIVTLLGGN